MTGSSLRRLVLAVVVIVALAGVVAWLARGRDDDAAAEGPLPEEFTARVDRVVDGDTVVVDGPTGAEKVRLLGIDTPETKRPGEPVQCYGPQASARTSALLAPGAEVRVELDPTQDERDRYGRLLAYLHLGRDAPTGPASVNRELVAEGYARVYVYGRPFRYADEFRAAEETAREEGMGLWGSCPVPAPAPAAAASGSGSGSGACDPGYEGACIPPPPPDLDCDDVPRGVRVVGDDPHHLDGDGDGWACA